MIKNCRMTKLISGFDICMYKAYKHSSHAPPKRSILDYNTYHTHKHIPT